MDSKLAKHLSFIRKALILFMATMLVFQSEKLLVSYFANATVQSVSISRSLRPMSVSFCDLDLTKVKKFAITSKCELVSPKEKAIIKSIKKTNVDKKPESLLRHLFESIIEF